MGGLCLIGEFMKNLSELIDKHEEIFGDQSLRITSLPTMTELRMTEDEKRKKQKRDWYHENKEKVLEQQKNFKKKKQQKEWYANNKVQQIDKAKKWNKDNQSARKLIVDRYKNKQKNKGWSNGN
tara:strand:+ start:658 stop:1029 length:372 start_codon:yes stop_codon:yes gene_type:complete